MNNEKVFSVTREDNAFDAPDSLNKIIRFAEKAHLAPTYEGAYDNRDENYNFKYQSTPHLLFGPVNEEIINDIDIANSQKLEINDLVLHVNILDKLFNIREHITEIPLSDLQYEKKRLPIDLKKYDHLSFKSGYTVECFISRKDNTDEENNFFWHKSQQIVKQSYDIKTSSEGSLFDIKWRSFGDDYEKKYVTHYIEWLSDDVSNLSCEETFEVVGNEQIQDDIMRFSRRDPQKTGKFIINLIFYDIAKELIEKTLRFANTDEDPEEESLHFKIKEFIDKTEEDFDYLCEQMRGSNTEQINVAPIISKLIQKDRKLAEIMGDVIHSRRL